MWAQMISLISSHLIVPFVFLTFAGKKHKDKITSISWIFLSFTYVSYIFLTGVWDWVGYYFRYIWIVALLIVLYQAYRKHKQVPFGPERSWKSWITIIFFFILSIVFLVITIFSFVGRYYKETPLELQFPLRNGNYYVAHGGSVPIINYHNEYLPQQYALDIVKINSWGFRTKGLYPDELDKYAIYGDRLYSPCQGTVLKSVDGFEDRIPSDYMNGLPEGTPAAGNHVIIDCNGTEVYIAHMQKGSVQVQAGDIVDEHTWIGNVGNSGNTSEPHLHIHAERNGIGIPIIFDGRFLVRNDVIRSLE